MKDKMKFLPYSNGFYKIKHIRIIRPGSIIKNIAIVLIVILAIGMGYQYIVDKEINNLSTKNKYVKIDNKKYYFKSVGDEKPTIVVDSDLGFGLSQWSRVQTLIESKYSLRTFAYDRPGYGFSDYGNTRTPEEQARLLRMILKKVSLSGPYILVGEGYGSLIICNFAKLYPDLVKGVILINPINESKLEDKEYMKQFSKEKFSSYIQKIGSYVGVNEILSNIGILKNYDELVEYMGEEDTNNYNIFRTKKNFTAAYNGELENVINKTSNAQQLGMFNDVPLVIITNENKYRKEQIEMSSLGSPNLTKIINVEGSTGIISLENPEIMLDAIRFILDNSSEQE